MTGYFNSDQFQPWLILSGKRVRVEVRIRISIVVFVDEEKLHSLLLNFGMYLTGWNIARTVF